MTLAVGDTVIKVKVTAQDALMTTTYTVTVNRAASTDATLSGLTVTGGGSDLVTFASGTTTYTASVANAVAEVTVTAMTTDSEATIDYLDGDDSMLTDAGAADGHQVALAVGDNVIKVTVTAADGNTTETYTVTVNRAASMDAMLSGLKVTGGGSDLVTFASGTYTYTASVANAVAEVTVTATKNDADAMIDYLDGDDSMLTDAGAADGHQVALAVGDTVIKVKVTAADGNNTETYTVTVNRAASDTTAPTLTSARAGRTLITLIFSEDLVVRVVGGVATMLVKDAFSLTVNEMEQEIETIRWSGRRPDRLSVIPSSTIYPGQTVVLSYDQFAAGVDAITDPADNKVADFTTGSGSVPAVVNISVLSMDATLSALVVNDGRMDLRLTPVFASGTIDYAASVVNAVDKVTVTPTLNDSGATINYLDGSDMTLTDAGTADGHQVTLAVGDTVIKVKVTAQDGNTTQTYTVTVDRAGIGGGGNDPPLAVDDAAETVEDTPVFIDVLANDSDPNGDPLTVVEVSAPAHGTAMVAAAGTVEYTPEPDFHGTDRFTYVVGDGSGLTAQAAVEVTVLPANDPPLAGDDAADTPEDTSVTIAVLANDSDPDGDALALVEASAPAHGSARLTDAGAVEYTPEPDFHGTDRFTYVVGDGSGLTAQAAVEVTVLPVNDPPLAGDDAADTPEDTSVTIAVLANDSDPDGDALALVEASAPAHGTARG